MSEKAPKKQKQQEPRRRTRQQVRELREEAGTERDQESPATGQERRSVVHSSTNPEHVKRCFLCASSSEYEASRTRRRGRTRSRASSTSSRSTRASTPPQALSREVETGSPEPAQSIAESETPTEGSVIPVKADSPDDSDLEKLLSPDELKEEQEDTEPDTKPEISTPNPQLRDTEEPIPGPSADTTVHSIFARREVKTSTTERIDHTETATKTSERQLPLKKHPVTDASGAQPVAVISSIREESPPATLASTAKPQPVPPPAKTQAPQPPAAAPSKPSAPSPVPQQSSAQTQKIPVMASAGGPLTRLQAQHTGAQDAGHRQVSAASVDEVSLDKNFGIAPKWYYIKSNHEETANWLESATSDNILLELLHFAHDQGTIHSREIETHMDKEIHRAMEGIEKLECLDAFCKTFIREGRFRPSGKIATGSSSKEDKYGRLFRMINADLQNLQRQHRILSMVCAGTADHEVHTQAQRENLRKLVEDLVHIVHPGDRGTYSEVYKVITESAAYDQRVIKPQLSSLKLVAHPDIVVPFGGPIVAGGLPVRSESFEHKIRAKLPSLLIKMHFSDRLQDQKWPDLNKADDSGIASHFDATNCEEIPLPTGTSTPTGTGSTSRTKAGKEEKATSGKAAATPSSGGSRPGKRKQPDDTTPTRPKRHREDISAANYDSQPPEAHVINEIYSEHVAELICALSQSPLGYVRHFKYPVSSTDDRDGSANVAVLGMIVSGEDVYFTKLDASHDYLDSLVETFRMDQLSFSCMSNPLNLYKGSHLKALLLFLRFSCLNFPRTTFFLSD